MAAQAGRLTSGADSTPCRPQIAVEASPAAVRFYHFESLPCSAAEERDITKAAPLPGQRRSYSFVDAGLSNSPAMSLQIVQAPPTRFLGKTGQGWKLIHNSNLSGVLSGLIKTHVNNGILI